MKAADSSAAMRRGMAFIAAQQQKDGGFVSHSSSAARSFRVDKTYQTTFAPALILAALTHLDTTEAKQVRHKLATWLLQQRSPNWSFNYWAVSAPERATLPYPDDLDDTFCALLALKQHDPSLIDAKCLGTVVKLLIATESQVGGPYRTWLVAKSASKTWQDVDLAVNCNVAAFLNMVAEPLPNLTAFMEEAIKDQRFQSPYYPSPYPLFYYLARAYNGPRKQALAAHIISLQADGWWGSPLNTALAVSALARLGESNSCQSAVARLLRKQLPDGSWGAEAFCLDPALQGKRYYSGSSALSTALCLEALALLQTDEARARTENKHQKTLADFHTRATALIQTELHAAGPTLERDGLCMLEQLNQQDKTHEISLLPHLFNQSLLRPVGRRSKRLTDLSAANLYGWMAYTIYDDFLDGEGQPALLPVANMTLRASVEHFERAVPTVAFRQLVRATFDRIDSANAWELERCRAKISRGSILLKQFPTYPQTLMLADRSLGHTLTPLGVLALAGIEPNDAHAVSIQLALRHYLVARQLNDDLHDWENDTRAGILTYVVAKIFADLELPAGSYSLAKLIPKMQRQFWHHSLPAICQTILEHTKKARSLAETNPLLSQDNIIVKLADDIENVVHHTLEEQAKATAFLEAYTKT